MSDQTAKRFYVSGMVQGVGYRFFAQRVANRLGIRGCVKNLFDGRVEVYAIGSLEKQKAFRDALSKGPSFANVTEVAEAEAELLEEFAGGFSIEHED